MASYLSNDTISYKIMHFLVRLLQCLFPPLSSLSFHRWSGRGPTVSVLKFSMKAQSRVTLTKSSEQYDVMDAKQKFVLTAKAFILAIRPLTENLQLREL